MSLRRKNFLKGLISTILCLFAFVFILAGISIGVIRYSISENAMNEVFKDIELSEIQIGAKAKTQSNIPDDKVPEAAADSEEEYPPETAPFNTNSPESKDLYDEALAALSNNDVNNGTLTEFIYSYVDPAIIDKYNITEEHISEILDQDVNKQFIVDKLKDYSEGLTKDISVAKISQEEILSLIEANEEIIYKVTGYQITQEDYDTITNEIESSGILEQVSLTSVSAQTNINFDSVRWIISDTTLLATSIMALMSLLLLFLVNRKNIGLGFSYGGVTLLIVGLVLLSVYVSSFLIAEKLESIIPVDASLIDVLLKGARSFTVISGIIAAGTGISMLISYSIIKRRKSKILHSPNAQ